MAPLNLALSANKRTNFPEAVTVNVLSERAPTKPNEPEALIARPGLEAFQTAGGSNIRGLFQSQGLFDNAALTVVDTGVYTIAASGTVTTYSGTTVAGDEIVDIDAGLDADGVSLARIANGSAMYKVASGVVTQESFPSAGNNVGATSVAFYKGYWLGAEADTDAVYYQKPAETTWNAIQFAAAEYAPDKIRAIRPVGDLVALLGERTTEFWYATGNDSSPLEPYGGLKFDIGCRARPTAVNCQGALIWVDDSSSVRLWDGGEPQIISDNGLAEQIRNVAAADLRAGFYIKDQHPCYVLRLGGVATWLFDLSTRRWTRMTSDGYAYWRAHMFCNVGDAVLAADSLSNQFWRLDPDRATDGTDTFTKEFTAFSPAGDAPIPLANVEVRCKVGGAPLTGQGSDPLMWLEVSRDGGETFGPKKYRSLGTTGDYTKRVRWNALGVIPAGHDVVIRFGCSDPVAFRISSVQANVP